MSKEYIEKEAAIKAAQDGADEWDGGCDRSRNTYIERAIDKVLPADVKPVARGEWIWDEHTGKYHCSRCGEPAPLLKDGDDEYIYKPNFCPNCGFDMREEVNGDE